MQNAMAKNDALVEYLKHTGSGLFAVPPGIAPGQYLGQSLFTRGNGARPRTRLESKRGGTAGTTKVVAAIPPARGSAAGNGRSA